jgi:hypothetical protein
MAILNETKKMRIRSISSHFQSIKNTQFTSLGQINMAQGYFDPQVKAIFDRYKLYKYLDKAGD